MLQMLLMRKRLGVEGIVGRLVVGPSSLIRCAVHLVWERYVCHAGRIVR